MDYQRELEESLRFLNSEKALQSLSLDAYWPKWNSTWWHMLLLYEMGLAKEIPEKVIESYIDALNRMPLKIFPIHKSEMPPNVDPYRGSPCHCQLGNVYQVLAANGVDVDLHLPWIRPWFLRYQMADGGLNCDNDAYLIKDETPSSMVGTIAAFESILFFTDREFTAEEKSFISKGAKFLIDRQLRLGSSSKHNQAEQESAKDWMNLCFPRFYLYDVLRGLNALLIWADKTSSSIPELAVSAVFRKLTDKFSDGLVKNERLSFAGVGTISPGPDGVWLRRQPADYFPLLTKVSEIGRVSPFLTKQWLDCRLRLERHLKD